MAKKTFILSDESLNGYGFRLLTAGCDLSAFLKNPVMLMEHRVFGDDFVGPIGKWENILTHGSLLKADTVFDESDEKAKKIAAKVEGGFIKAASVGFEILETSTDPALMIPGQTRPTVTKWKLKEASLCAIPSNENALALYDKDGSMIMLSGTGTDVQLNSLLPKIQNQNPSEMIKLKQTVLTALSLNENASQEVIESAIEKLHADYTALKTERANEVKLRAESLVNKAIEDKKITASEKDEFLKLAQSDYATAEKVIAKLSAPKLPASNLNQGAEKKVGAVDLSGMNYRDAEKKHLKELQKLKASDPDTVAEMYKESYGKYPSWHKVAVMVLFMLCTLFTFSSADAQTSGGGISYQGVKVEWTFPTDVTANRAPVFPSWDTQAGVAIASDTVEIIITDCHTIVTTDSLFGNPVVKVVPPSYLTAGCSLTIQFDGDTCTFSTGFGTVPTLNLATDKYKVAQFIYDGTDFWISGTPIQLN